MKKSSLQFELSLKISLFFIMIMLAVSSGTIAYLSNRYNKIIIDDMNSNLVNAVNTIDYYFDDVKTPMVMISRNSSIQKVLKNYQGTVSYTHLFQSYALFPTMTVYENLAFGLKVKKLSAAEIDKMCIRDSPQVVVPPVDPAVTLKEGAAKLLRFL